MFVGTIGLRQVSDHHSPIFTAGYNDLVVDGLETCDDVIVSSQNILGEVWLLDMPNAQIIVILQSRATESELVSELGDVGGRVADYFQSLLYILC